MLIAEQDPASLQAVVTDIGLVKDGKLAPVVPLASIINDAAAWEDAGVLPPIAARKRLADVKSGGEVLVSVSGIKTQLQRRDGQPVLENVNFQIRAGEVVALIGKTVRAKPRCFNRSSGFRKLQQAQSSLAARMPTSGRLQSVPARWLTCRRTCAAFCST